MIFAIRDLLGLVFFPSIHSRHLAVLPWEVSFRKCRNSPTFLKSKQVKRFREREREREASWLLQRFTQNNTHFPSGFPVSAAVTPGQSQLGERVGLPEENTDVWD